MGDVDVRAKVIEIVAERYDKNPDSLSDSTSYLDDLGADSLDIAELVMEFEDSFDITIPEDEQGISTIGETVSFIEKKLNEEG